MESTSGLESSASSGAHGTDSSTTGEHAICGDGIVDPDEECDDSNVDDGDACSANCTVPFEPSWTATYNGPSSLADSAYGVVVAGDGTIYVVGSTFSAAQSDDLWLREYAPDGTEGWTFTFDGAESDRDRGYDLALHPSGDLVAVGFTSSEATGWDALVLRVSVVDQTVVWQQTHDGTFPDVPDAGGDIAAGVAVSADGYIVVAGEERDEIGEWNMWLRRYDADGVEQWTRTYDGAAGLEDRYTSVAIDAEGDVWVVGDEELVDGRLGWIRRFDAAGELIDEHDLPDDALFDVAVDDVGGVFVCGRTPQVSYTDGLVVEFDLDFVEQWRLAHNSPDLRNDANYGLAVGPNGDVYVAGAEYREHRGTDWDIWNARVSGADGAEVWSDRLNGDVSLEDLAREIAVGSDGSIVAVGLTTVTGEDENVWIRRYAEP